MIGIYQLLFTYRIAMLWIWLAGFVAVAKGTFAVPVVIKEMKG